MSDNKGSLKAVYVALIGNFLISVIKYIVSFITGSSALLSEAIHTTADCTNQVFLLIGNKRSKKKATEQHSFGYERESFFWALLVAILLFFVGAAFSVYEGVHKLINPEPLHHIYWIFLVLIASILIEGKSFLVAHKEFRKRNKKSFVKGIEDSTDTNLVVILLEDFAALTGLVIVLITTIVSIFFPIFDAIGSILVGILLGVVAFKLADEIRKLIVGESMPREGRSKIKSILNEYDMVEHINKVQTMVIGNNKYLVLISIDVEDDITGYDLEDHIEQIKLDIKRDIPEVDTIYIDIKDVVRNNKI